MISLEEVLAEWAKDSQIDRTRLDYESLRSGELHTKYLQILYAVKKRLARAQAKQSELLALKSRYYQGKMTREEMDQLGWPYDPWRGNNKPMKSDTQAWLDIDPDVAAGKESIEDLSLIHDAAFDILNHIAWRHQNIKNAISWLQFTSGM